MEYIFRGPRRTLYLSITSHFKFNTFPQSFGEGRGRGEHSSAQPAGSQLFPPCVRVWWLQPLPGCLVAGSLLVSKRRKCVFSTCSRVLRAGAQLVECRGVSACKADTQAPLCASVYHKGSVDASVTGSAEKNGR